MGLPITVTVGPLATADPDGVSLSQTAAGAQNLVINGALAAGTFDADSICASQSPGAAGAITINGADYPGGAYLYDLLVGGRQVDVKRMVLSKR